MLMPSTVSGTFSASSAAAWMWCRVQPAGRHSSCWNSQGMRQSWAHSLPVYQGGKTQIKNYLTCKGILCSKSKHKCLLTETTREKSISCTREVHTVPFRKRYFEFETRPWYIQYPSGVVTPGKGVLKIELQMPIQHGGRERDRTSNSQNTATSSSWGWFLFVYSKQGHWHMNAHDIVGIK